MVNGADLFVMADIRGGAAEKGRTGYNSSDIALAESTAELLAPFPAAPPLQRSNSVFDTERKQPRHWLRRSLPPAKRERHRENAKSSGTVWCGSSFEMALLIDIQPTGLGYCRKCHCRPRNDITAKDHVTDLTLMERGEQEEGGVVWMLTRPHNCVYCWCSVSERLVMKVECSVYSSSPGE